ncbi:1675_t:CDS:1, partial [Gigaspora rosea]
MLNLLDLIPPELIPFITKYLPIQDLKNCYSLDDIWKTEAIREIRKRLIVDCSFIDSKTTVKALIDPKSQYNSISKALARKMDLYITRMYGSKYPVVEALGVGVTNAGKKVMVGGWLCDEEVSISLPNIFDVSQPLADLGPSSYLGNSYEHFLVVDKPEYDLVLGSTWLTRLENRIDGRDGRYWESNEEKRIYYARNSIDILSPSLYTFYELLFPKFSAINSDREVILIEFSDQNMENNLIDLNEYYDSRSTHSLSWSR